MNRGLTLALKITAHVAALVPLFLLVLDFARDNLTADPIREIQLRTGAAAIILLLASLACTPINILTGFKAVLLLRRPLGLYAFGYALLHFINFIGVDYGFDFGLLRGDLFEKRYAVAGFAAFVLMLPLAVASFRRHRERISQLWQKLGWLVYGAAILAVVHYVWQTKAGFTKPVITAALLAFMLIVRLPVIRKFLNRNLPWL